MGVKQVHSHTNGVCFTLEVTDYFIQQLSATDWLTMARDSSCAEAFKTQLPSFVSVTLCANVSHEVETSL